MKVYVVLSYENDTDVKVFANETLARKYALKYYIQNYIKGELEDARNFPNDDFFSSKCMVNRFISDLETLNDKGFIEDFLWIVEAEVEDK